MAENVTVMVLKVDLHCPCCYKKVKKILCKFPEIRDQEYDEKENKVTITVVCCNPEKIRDKLCCKGVKVIKSIEIKEPTKSKKPDEQEKSGEVGTPSEKHKKSSKPEPTPNPPTTPIPVLVFPMRPTCCRPCSQGYGGGSCHCGYGVPPPPQPCYDGHYGNGCHGNARGTHYYFIEDSPQSFSMM